MSRQEKLARWLLRWLVGEWDERNVIECRFYREEAKAIIDLLDGEEATQWQKQRTQILDALDHAHEYETPMALAASIRAILSLP